jgi:hypothetical protein
MFICISLIKLFYKTSTCRKFMNSESEYLCKIVTVSITHPAPFEYKSSQVSVTFGFLYSTARSMVQHTDYSDISCSSRLFFSLFLHLAHNVAVFLWPASAEKVLLQVGSFESPNCWADLLAHYEVQYSRCVREQQDP